MCLKWPTTGHFKLRTTLIALSKSGIRTACENQAKVTRYQRTQVQTTVEMIIQAKRFQFEENQAVNIIKHMLLQSAACAVEVINGS